jgi:hypothetical protein
MSTVTEEPPTQNTSACKEMPGPVKEHELLQKFVGEWESEGEAFMAPGQPPTKLKGVESSRLIGGFWFVAHGNGFLSRRLIAEWLSILSPASSGKFSDSRPL